MDCASEPIRVPGAIQPHGWLLSVDGGDGSVVAWDDTNPEQGPASKTTIK